MKPIIFSAPMVRAILSGAKTQTRRVMDPQPIVETRAGSFMNVWRPKHAKLSGHENVDAVFGATPCSVWRPDLDVMESGAAGIVNDCPYGKVGDTLWVRESFAMREDLDWRTEPEKVRHYALYKADNDQAVHDPNNWHNYGTWRSSIHMPRCLSRITLTITCVLVERLQHITGMDVASEGFPLNSDLDQFKLLWNKLNSKNGYHWDTNPWVWAISFKKDCHDDQTETTTDCGTPLQAIP